MGSTFDEKVEAVKRTVKPRGGETKEVAARKIVGAMVRNEKKGGKK